MLGTKPAVAMVSDAWMSVPAKEKWLAGMIARAVHGASVQSCRGAFLKIFSPLYERTMVWSRHPRAPWFLGGLSFAESSFFPIPPDVMLAPMCLANPHRAWWFALLTTLTSVAGGLFGYLIGYYAFDLIEPWLRGSHYWSAY